MSTLLEVKHLGVKFDKNIIHKDLSFDIKEGETITLLGPNGSGKSVLLKVLLGLLPHTGEVIWHKNSRIGYLPQSLNHQAIKDMPLSIKDFFELKKEKFSQKKMVDCLESVGLQGSFLEKSLGTLSGGQYQRVLVAWVLISKPDVLFLDEPTTGIDVGGGENIYSLIESLRKDNPLTVVLVTHHIHIVYAHSDTVLCLQRKNHTCIGKPKAILTPEMLQDIFGMEVKFYKHD